MKYCTVMKVAIHILEQKKKDKKRKKKKKLVWSSYESFRS